MVGKRLLTITFLGIMLSIQGCSSSQKSGDETASDMGPLESGADTVGSIPEDELAKEEAADGENAAEATAEPAPETGTDPFADLANSPEAQTTQVGGEATTAEATDFATTEEAPAATASEEGTLGGTETYVVKSGDTLMKIAFNLYGDIDRWKDLRDWNRAQLKNSNQLRAGMNLNYEPPMQPFQPEKLAHSYLIKKGDTLAGIADEVYGRRVKYKKLQRFNQSLIRNPHRIFAGFTIFYDITAQEMSEAEARRKEKLAATSGFAEPTAPAPQVASPQPAVNTVPSPLSPPVEAAKPGAKPLAVSPPPPAPVPVPVPAPIAPPPAPASTN